MNVKSLSIVAGLIVAFGSNAAFAADEYVLNHNLPANSDAASTAPRTAVRVAAVDDYQNNQNVPAAVVHGLQRAQVVAEAIEARKLGLISEGERLAPAPTPAQAEHVRLAGLNAISQQLAAK